MVIFSKKNYQLLEVPLVKPKMGKFSQISSKLVYCQHQEQQEIAVSRPARFAAGKNISQGFICKEVGLKSG